MNWSTNISIDSNLVKPTFCRKKSPLHNHLPVSDFHRPCHFSNNRSEILQLQAADALPALSLCRLSVRLAQTE